MSLQKLGTRVLLLRAERARVKFMSEAKVGAAVCTAGLNHSQWQASSTSLILGFSISSTDTVSSHNNMHSILSW